MKKFWICLSLLVAVAAVSGCGGPTGSGPIAPKNSTETPKADPSAPATAPPLTP